MSTKKQSIKSIITGIFFLLSGQVIALPPKNTYQNIWAFSLQGGTAMFISEITPGFQFLKNEFQHRPELTYDLAVSRTIGERWESGARLGFYKLTGIAENPSFSAIGNFSRFNNLYEGIPVEYNNLSSSLLFIVRYHFYDFKDRHEKQLQLNPFIELGGGMNIFASEVEYQTLPPGFNRKSIFIKAGNNKGNVGQVSIGIGSKVNFGKALDLFVTLNTDWVNYDCADGVHNYNSNGERIHAETIVMRLMAGIIIPLRMNIYYNRPGTLPFSP